MVGLPVGFKVGSLVSNVGLGVGEYVGKTSNSETTSNYKYVDYIQWRKRKNAIYLPVEIVIFEIVA